MSKIFYSTHRNTALIKQATNKLKRTNTILPPHRLPCAQTFPPLCALTHIPEQAGGGNWTGLLWPPVPPRLASFLTPSLKPQS